VTDVRKWARWQKQGITIAVLGVVAIFVGLAIAAYSGQTYRGYGYNSVANFAFCGVIPGGIFMIVAGIASYYYYGWKVKRHGKG